MAMNDKKLWALSSPDLHDLSAEKVLANFANCWDVYGVIMSSLKEEKDYYVQPNPLRHPLVFYVGHTASFCINKLVLAGIIKEEERPNKDFDALFAVGVDEQEWDDVNEDHYIWPPMADVWEYRKAVRCIVEKAIKETDWSQKALWDNTRQWCLVMCVEHERIHLETSTVLIREMDVARVVKPEGWVYGPSNGQAPVNDLVRIEAGVEVTLGRPRDSKGYGWDVEYGTETTRVGPFEVSQFHVTNAEFRLFVNAKGYNKKELWSERGWKWSQGSGRRHPHFWVAKDASKYMLRVMYDVIDMPMDWPVEVNYYEAEAYCNWKGEDFRLMTEAEYRVMTGVTDADAAIAADPTFAEDAKVNLGLRFGSSTPVNHFPANSLGVYDAAGNVWDWSSSMNRAFEGFKHHPLYEDFSLPCMDEEHNMILGGSFASTGDLASIFARYSFRRHFFQHSGFRLCRSADEANVYETKQSLHEYLLFHYGSPEQILGDFVSIGPVTALEYPTRCSEKCISAYRAIHGADAVAKRALDMGCAVGRSSFELAKGCEEVVGIDYSQAFANAGSYLAEHGTMPYTYKTEGDITADAVAVIDPSIDRSRVSFQAGDAHNIPESLGTFDLFLGANLVDRLHHPRQFLDRLPSLMNPGGVVILTTPFTWLRQFTDKENWLGGFVGDDDKPVYSADTLHSHLGEHFERVEEGAMPFLIRETRRKFQWTAAYLSVWRRKD